MDIIDLIFSNSNINSRQMQMSTRRSENEAKLRYYVVHRFNTQPVSLSAKEPQGSCHSSQQSYVSVLEVHSFGW
jgi:hypothetical protein